MTTKTKKPTISEIAYIIRTQSNSHYFDLKTLKFFKQTLASFKVKVSPKGNVYVYAPMYSPSGFAGYSFTRFAHVEGWKDKTYMAPIGGVDKNKLEDILGYISRN